MPCVDNADFMRTNALLAVEWSVENQRVSPDVVHTLHTLHNIHIASTMGIHKMWKNPFYIILFLISSITEAKELSDSIISSTRLQALIAVV